MKKIHILAAIIALASNPIFATSEALPPVPEMPEAPEAPEMDSENGDNPFIGGNDAAGNNADDLVNNEGDSESESGDFPLDDPEVSSS